MTPYQASLNQAIVDLLNSACDELHQYVILDGSFLDAVVLRISLKRPHAPLAQLDRATAF